MALQNLGKKSEAKFSFNREEKISKIAKSKKHVKEEQSWEHQEISAEEKLLCIWKKEKDYSLNIR